MYGAVHSPDALYENTKYYKVSAEPGSYAKGPESRAKEKSTQLHESVMFWGP